MLRTLCGIGDNGVLVLYNAFALGNHSRDLVLSGLQQRNSLIPVDDVVIGKGNLARTLDHHLQSVHILAESIESVGALLHNGNLLSYCAPCLQSLSVTSFTMGSGTNREISPPNIAISRTALELR